MVTAENTIYLNFTKSIVDGFEEFVTNVEKHGNILGDDEIRYKLKLISKKLQKIVNRWESKCDKKHFNSTPGETTPNKVENIEVLKRSNSWDDFDSMIANSVGHVPTTPIVTEVSNSTSSSNKLDISILDDLKSMLQEKEKISSLIDEKNTNVSESIDEPITYQLKRKEAEIVRKFDVENVKKEWILGSNGFYVEESSRGSWKCHPCKLEALSYSNIISHALGKGHIRKLENYDRELSATRQKVVTNMNPNLNVISNIQTEFTKFENGANVDVPFKGFYCHACRGTLDSEEALKLHLSGGKHRKNYES